VNVEFTNAVALELSVRMQSEYSHTYSNSAQSFLRSVENDVEDSKAILCKGEYEDEEADNASFRSLFHPVFLMRTRNLNPSKNQGSEMKSRPRREMRVTK